MREGAGRVLWAVPGAASLGFGQQPTLPSFEAASVKPNQLVTGLIVPAKKSNPSRAKYRNFPLKLLIVDANGLAYYQARGLAWLATQRFDIVDVKPPGTTAA
jgi:uncharacterized protein (TIGR03435 family)